MFNRRVYGVHVPWIHCLGWHAVRFVWRVFFFSSAEHSEAMLFFRMGCKSWNHNATGWPIDGDSIRSTHQFCSTQSLCRTNPFVSLIQLKSYYDWIIFENRKLSNVYLPCFESACKRARAPAHRHIVLLCITYLVYFSLHYKRIKLSAANAQWIWLCRHIPNSKTDFG